VWDGVVASGPVVLCAALVAYTFLPARPQRTLHHDVELEDDARLAAPIDEMLT
jgi:hypothetical protein